MKETEHLTKSSPTISNNDMPSTSASSSGTATPTSNDAEDEGQSRTILHVVEDEIDVILSHQSGLIQRKKHPQL